MTSRRLAVALHDIEPQTFERCALIRDWLDDHGVDRVTLVVVPAPDLHPFNDRSPELAGWLAERVGLGDAVAQQGLAKGRLDAVSAAEARRAVLAGRRLLHLAGVEAHGFVAPAYAYSPTLQQVLAPTFAWWAGLHRLWFDHGAHSLRATALRTSPLALRLAAAWPADVLRLDVRPSQLDRPRTMAALEHVLTHRTSRRTAVTYDGLWTTTS